jgi:molecular chaperone DnaK (HSP70)
VGCNVSRLALLEATSKMPKILRNELANESTPTSIAFPSGEARMYGDNATSKEISKPQCAVGDLVQWVQRHTAETRSVGDVDELTSSCALGFFLRNILTFVPKESLAVSKVTISVPAACSEEGLVATKSAAVLAGVPAERVLLANSSEAVLAYMHHSQRASLPSGEGASPLPVVVIDIGKGNASVVAATLTAEKVTILSAKAAAVGSNFIDEAIADHVFKQLDAKHNGSELRSHAKSFQKILRECRKAKEMLSSVDSARVQAEGLKDDIDANLSVTRKEVDELTAPFLEQLVQMFKETVTEHGAVLRSGPTGEIRVECVGAGWRSACIADAIKNIFGISRIGVSLDGNMAVGEGCAILGAIVDASIRKSDAEDGRDALHTVELEGFVSPTRVVDTLPADILDALTQAEVALLAQDEAIHVRIRAINALDSYVLQTLEAAYHCTKDSARQEELRSALLEDEEYARDDCNGDAVDVIESRLQALRERIADKFPEVAAHYEAKKAEEERKDAELKRISEMAQSEEKELKSDPQRLRAAQQRREQGQNLFKQEHWAESQTRFVQALSILGELYDIKDEDTKKKKDEIALSCHLNISSCSIKLQMWRNALNNATSALDLSPQNPKALFRRGQAASMMNDYATARADLELAKQLTNGDAAIVAELEAVISKEAAEKSKEKKMFSRMFA